MPRFVSSFRARPISQIVRSHPLHRDLSVAKTSLSPYRPPASLAVGRLGAQSIAYQSISTRLIDDCRNTHPSLLRLAKNLNSASFRISDRDISRRASLRRDSPKPSPGFPLGRASRFNSHKIDRFDSKARSQRHNPFRLFNNIRHTFHSLRTPQINTGTISEREDMRSASLCVYFHTEISFPTQAYTLSPIRQID